METTSPSRPDLRGFNLSDKPADVAAYRAKHLVSDIAFLAKHFGKQRFTLVAHDWGGAVAWSFAAAFPDLLERLIIINSPHPAIFQRDLAGNPEQQAASSYMNFFVHPGRKPVLSENNYARMLTMLNGWGGNPGSRTRTAPPTWRRGRNRVRSPAASITTARRPCTRRSKASKAPPV